MPTIEMKTELPGPTSRAIIARKERVVCDPLDLHMNAVIDHGFGAAVTDVDGNTMLDLSSGLEQLDEALDVLADSALAARTT